MTNLMKAESADWAAPNSVPAIRSRRSVMQKAAPEKRALDNQDLRQGDTSSKTTRNRRHGQAVESELSATQGAGSQGKVLSSRRPSMDIARLSVIEILKSVPREHLMVIAQQCRWSSVRKGQQVLFQDDTSNDVMFLCSGRVKATIFSPSGKEIAYEELDEGSVFGEMAALDNSPRSTHVVAVSDCIVATLGGETFVELMRKWPEVGIDVSRKLCNSVRFLCSRIFEFSTLSVNDRIESELLRVADNRGAHSHVSEQPFEIVQPPTHAEIASRVNTHREAVTKHLNELDRAGLIKRKGRTLVIPDIKKIQARVSAALDQR